MHLSLKRISSPYGAIQTPLKLRGKKKKKIKGQERGRERRGSRGGREGKGKIDRTNPSYFSRCCTGLYLPDRGKTLCFHSIFC